MILLRIILISAFCFFSLMHKTQATELNMQGTLIVISCTINNNQPLDVSFGDAVGIKKVDGENYRKPIPLEINCSRSPGDLLNIMFVGAATEFENSALATGSSDLGIRLLQDLEKIEINKPLPLDAENMPQLYAVPVKRPESKLTAGKFHATATLAIILE